MTPPARVTSTQSLVKPGVFVLEGLNTVATTYYFYFIYFFMAERFGFGNLQNLALAATSGFVYTFAAAYGGRFGQRRGYFFANGIGYVVMASGLLIGAQLSTLPGQVLILIVCTFGMCFTWPNLQALVSENEPPLRLQRMLGIYNLIWAGGGAIAYFSGGALIDSANPRRIFFVPAAIHVVQLILTIILARRARRPAVAPLVACPAEQLTDSSGHHRRSPIPQKAFLKMAWIANPFAYVAINTVVAVIPGIAVKLNLSPKAAGIFCSIWFFARTGSFVLLWLWPGWHYRFRFLIGAYAAMLLCFGTMLTSTQLPILVLAQIGFGVALGLIYYSSIYYSMDACEDKGEHGGLHEAAIGAGLCGGPLIGALALYFFPDQKFSGVIAVCIALLIGFVWLLRLRWKR